MNASPITRSQVPEVLSVCSVQFKGVLDGIRQNRNTCFVEGDEVALDHTCAAFITMNPGYLGRAELPEGLKALFRPMTVMVPDLVLICENMLSTLCCVVCFCCCLSLRVCHSNSG